jgi:hypothetical protein
MSRTGGDCGDQRQPPTSPTVKTQCAPVFNDVHTYVTDQRVLAAGPAPLSHYSRYSGLQPAFYNASPEQPSARRARPEFPGRKATAIIRGNSSPHGFAQPSESGEIRW